MVGHPVFVDPPSRDLTLPDQRQRELDAQIEAFLAKGGQIQAFDPQRRPIDATPWSAFKVNPHKAPAEHAPGGIARTRTRAAAKSPPTAAAEPPVETKPEPIAVPAAVPAAAEMAEAEASVADTPERVIARLLAPDNRHSEVAQALRELRKHAVAMHLVLDRLGVKR